MAGATLAPDRRHLHPIEPAAVRAFFRLPLKFHRQRILALGGILAHPQAVDRIAFMCVNVPVKRDWSDLKTGEG